MQRRSLKRATAVLAGVAIMAAGGLALAPAASAAPVGADLDAPGDEVFVVRTADQEAGDLTVTLTADAEVDDTITIRVANNQDDCSANEDAAEAIVFSDVPADDHDDVLVALQDGCAPGATINNEIVLTFTEAVSSGTEITLSSIDYDVGPEAPSGPVQLSVNGGALSDTESNATVVAIDRIFGDTRFDTAAAIAPAATGDADGCADTAVVVSGRNFPDALASAYLGHPILLTEPGGLSDAAADALQAMGADTVLVIGGTDAVSSQTFLDIEALEVGDCGGDVGVGNIDADRIAGPNRYATAQLVASSQGDAGTLDPGVNDCDSEVRTAILVSGEDANFADALAAGPLAAAGAQGCSGSGAIPIILTQTGVFRTEAQEAISEVNAEQVLIIGGPLAVSADVENEVEAMPGVDVTRIQGATRWITALEVAKVLRTEALGFEGELLIANGLNYPDALVGGPLGGELLAPIVLSEQGSLNGGVGVLISDPSGFDILDIHLLGGPVALSQKVFSDTAAVVLARNA